MKITEPPMSRRLRPTIRARLTLLYGGLFLIAGIVLLAVTSVLVSNNLHQGTSEVLTSDSGGDVALGGATRSAPATRLDTVTLEAIAEGSPARLISAGQAKGLLVQVRRDYERQTLYSLLTQGGIALGVVGAAALGLGWLLADRALRPVHQITETARRVARSHDLTERISYAGPHDDVKELADTFDTMLGRLARAFDGQQRFVANASHELRTPLAINRTLVDVALRRPDATEDVRRLGESLLVVNGRHERLIDGLLTLAGSENTVIDAVPLDLADVARHVIDQAGGEAAGHGVEIECDLGRAPVSGDPVLIERLVQNLVENAIRHNREPGELAVATCLAAGDGDAALRPGSPGTAEVVVTNTGPVVPPYEIETIFEPFRRLGTDRVRSDRGSGLGLSIVRAIATAHGGTVTAAPRPGGGLVVTVRMPAGAVPVSPRNGGGGAASRP